MCREYLVLASHGFAEHILFDMDGGLSQLRFAGHDVLQRVERMEQADGEGGTGSQPGSCRQVAVVMNFQPVVDIEVLEHAANRGMLDLLIAVYELDTRIGNPGAVLEKRRQLPAGKSVGLL